VFCGSNEVFMLTALRIGNFKAFAETQSIPVRPLTLIYGANSSGKSSVLHSLVLARHALETGNLDVHRTNMGGESVDLGGFRQYVHRCDVNRRVEWTVELDREVITGVSVKQLALPKKLIVGFTIGMSLDDQGHPIVETVPEISTYEICGDNNVLVRMSRRKIGLTIDFLEFKHSFFINEVKRRFEPFLFVGAPILII
jgi:hypothetical protein